MSKDLPLVLSLDAGGTNFVFSSVKNGEIFGETVRKPSYGDNLEKSLKSIVEGFEEVSQNLNEEIKAISFAFPGPSDFENGVIGDLWNLPGYRGGVALAPFLENKFNVPVFINNDGDLFAYGEYISGVLPDLNNRLKNAGSTKQYKNLTGLTLGTGFGLGVVNQGHLLRGDNSMPAEVWLMRGLQYPEAGVEESVSIRAIVRSFNKYLGTERNVSPKEIYEMAVNGKGLEKEAALKSYEEFGKNLGDAMASLISLFDSNIVIGGGISNAWDLFMPSVMDQFKSYLITPEGGKIPRLTHKVFNLENEKDFKDFAETDNKLVAIPGEDEKKYNYNDQAVAGIMRSSVGTSESIVRGAYYYALEKLGFDV